MSDKSDVNTKREKGYAVKCKIPAKDLRESSYTLKRWLLKRVLPN